MSEFPGKHSPREVLEVVLRHLGVAGTIEERDGDEPGVREITVRGDDAGLLIGHHGQTLDAVELLLNRMVPIGSRVHLDAGGYRERRAAGLAAQALSTADTVAQTGRAHALPPMTSRDRRSVHLALREHPAVETRSEGEEPHRVLVIFPRG